MSCADRILKFIERVPEGSPEGWIKHARSVSMYPDKYSPPLSGVSRIASPIANISTLARCLAFTIAMASFMFVGCASVSEPRFSANYSGAVHDAAMKLDLVRGLPDHGTSGWLVNTDLVNADGRFSARRGGYPKYTIDPSFVKFSAEKPEKGWAPASFHWEGDAFVVCMLYVQFGSAPNSDKMQIMSDYSLCAPLGIAA